MNEIATRRVLQPNRRAIARVLRAAAGALVLAVALAAAPAVGRADDDPSTPVVHAEVLATLPADRTMAIEPRDDTDENLKLRDLMARRLAERHGKLADNAPLVLRFSLEVISGRDRPPDRGNGGRGGMSGGGYAPPNSLPSDTPIIYRLNATLEQRDGPVLWRADVMARPTGVDEREMPARLAQTLIDNLGRAVDTRPAAGSSDPRLVPPPRPRSLF